MLHVGDETACRWSAVSEFGEEVPCHSRFGRQFSDLQHPAEEAAPTDGAFWDVTLGLRPWPWQLHCPSADAAHGWSFGRPPPYAPAPSNADVTIPAEPHRPKTSMAHRTREAHRRRAGMSPKNKVP